MMRFSRMLSHGLEGSSQNTFRSPFVRVESRLSRFNARPGIDCGTDYYREIPLAPVHAGHERQYPDL